MNPTSTQVKKVIETFEKVLPMAKRDEQLVMFSATIYKGSCGTSCCHGGWYVIACELLKTGEESFSIGAERMASDLGFSCRELLKRWFHDKPDIWGNYAGFGMFSNDRAFTPGDKTHASNLKDIYDHWCEVHDRLYLLEHEND